MIFATENVTIFIITLGFYNLKLFLVQKDGKLLPGESVCHGIFQIPFSLKKVSSIKKNLEIKESLFY